MSNLKVTENKKSSIRVNFYERLYAEKNIISADFFKISIFCIFMVAVVIRLIFLFQPMRYDEAFSFIVFSSNSLSTIMSNYLVPNNHIFHNILVHLFYKIFGGYPWVIRIPALVAGILIVVVNYFLMRNIYGRFPALFSCSLVANSSILIEYSTNARGYTLLLLFSLCVFYYGHKLLKKEQIKNWFFLILFSVLGIYTIPIMVFPLSVVVLWLLFSLKNGRKYSFILHLFISLGVVFVLTTLFYLPVIVNSGLKPLIGNRFVSPAPFGMFLNNLFLLPQELWRQWNRDIPFSLVVSLNAVFFFSIFASANLRRKHLLFIFSALTGNLLALLFIRRVGPLRCWLYLLPLYFGMLGASLAWFLEKFFQKLKINTKNTIFYLLTIILTLILSTKNINSDSILYSEEGGTLRSAKEIVLTLRNILKKGDYVISFCPSDYIIGYYFYLYQLPANYLQMSNYRRGKVYLILKHNQDLKTMLRKYKIPLSFKNPEFSLAYEDANMYIYEKEALLNY